MVLRSTRRRFLQAELTVIMVDMTATTAATTEGHCTDIEEEASGLGKTRLAIGFFRESSVTGMMCLGFNDCAAE